MPLTRWESLFATSPFAFDDDDDDDDANMVDVIINNNENMVPTQTLERTQASDDNTMAKWRLN